MISPQTAEAWEATSWSHQVCRSSYHPLNLLPAALLRGEGGSDQTEGSSLLRGCVPPCSKPKLEFLFENEFLDSGFSYKFP